MKTIAVRMLIVIMARRNSTSPVFRPQAPETGADRKIYARC